MSTFPKVKKGEDNILVTSALPYVNNTPHLGTSRLRPAARRFHRRSPPVPRPCRVGAPPASAPHVRQLTPRVRRTLQVT